MIPLRDEPNGSRRDVMRYESVLYREYAIDPPPPARSVFIPFLAAFTSPSKDAPYDPSKDSVLARVQHLLGATE